jgi:hypothetical protein
MVESGGIEQLAMNYRYGKRYSPKLMFEIENHWKKLYDEFYELRNNKSGKYSLNKNYELVKLSLTLELLMDIENRLIMLINLGYSKELTKFIAQRTVEAINDFKILYPRVKISMLDNCEDVLVTVQSVIKAQTNIFDEKAGAKQDNIEKQRETIYDIVSMMSKYLGYNLDVNNMSCMEFIGHENTINSASKKEQTK